MAKDVRGWERVLCMSDSVLQGLMPNAEVVWARQSTRGLHKSWASTCPTPAVISEMVGGSRPIGGGSLPEEGCRLVDVFRE